MNAESEPPQLKFSNEFLQKVGEKMRDHLLPTEGQIFGSRNIDSINGVHIGCGTYFHEKKDVFFLTAMHVGRASDKFDYAMHSRDKGNSFPFRGVWLGDPRLENDLAVYGCFSEAIQDTGQLPVNMSSLLVSSVEDVTGQLFFCQGVPGVDTTFLPMLKGIQVVNNPILSIGMPSTFGTKSGHTFSFRFPRKVDPRGMSGSAVWNTNLHLAKSESEWSIESITFAGVVQRWDQEQNVIIATKADAVNSFLPIAVEKLREMWLRTPNSDYIAPE